MPRFRVINGSLAPDTLGERVRRRLRAQPKPAELIQCPRCTGREVIETRIGAEKRNGKVRGGTKVLICADCLRRGKRVVVS